MPRPRLAPGLLSLALLSGAALVPSSVAQATPAAPTTVTAGVDDGDDLRLDRAQAELIRARVARIVEEKPAELAELHGMTAQAATVQPHVLRFGGANRYEVAANLADHYWGQYFWNPKHGAINFEKVVFVASGHDYPDALSGGAAAAAWGGPMLLTAKTEVPAATRGALTRLKPDVIVVLGGTGTISTAVEGALQEFVSVPANVTRVGGKDRWEVSASLARMIGYSEVAYVASGRNYPDGLAGGAAAGHQISPLLITQADQVPAAVMKVLKEDVLPARIYVLGGPNSVNEAVLTQLRNSLPGVVVERISGATRYDVAGNLAGHLPTQGVATVASGENWPDALAGSALAGIIGSKMLLTHPQRSLPAATRTAVERHGLASVDVLGGPASVPETLLTELRALRVADPGTN